jgi:hypothetical protein
LSPYLVLFLEQMGVAYLEYIPRMSHLPIPNNGALYHPWCYTKTELTALLEAQEAEMIKDCEEFEA